MTIYQINLTDSQLPCEPEFSTDFINFDFAQDDLLADDYADREEML